MAYRPSYIRSLINNNSIYYFNNQIKRFNHINRNIDKLRDEFNKLTINRVFILEKLTKYDIEIGNGYTPDQILHKFPLAFCTHITHKKIMSELIDLLTNKYSIHSIVVKAQTDYLTSFDENSAFSPDAIISAGGDGTFLEAASLIPARTYGSRGFWLVGLNTDPERSLGSLCISYPDDSNTLESPKKRVLKFVDLNYGLEDRSVLSEVTEFCNLDKFEFSHYDTFHSEFNESSTCIDEVNETEPTRLVKSKSSLQDFKELTTRDYVDSILHKLLVSKTCLPILRQRIRIKIFPRDSYEKDMDGTTRPSGYLYPFGAVNDVMIADESFGKTFYAFIQIDNKKVYKAKCSGVLISTGTGSTAWAYNISKLSINTVKRVSKILNNDIDDDKILSTYDEYNKGLTFPPGDNMLKCIIREPIQDGQGFRLSGINEDNCFMARQIKIRALSRSTKLCLDGSKFIDFYSGDTVIIAAFSTDVIHSCL